MATMTHGATVTLQWDHNPDATYYVVYWGEISGNYTSNSPNIPTPTTTYTVSGLLEQTYYFAVKAFNDCGNSSDFSTEVTYTSSGNTAPVANAGPDQNVSEGITVTLSAENSYDIDGSINSYQWLQTSGPTINLSSSTAVNPFFTSPDAGTSGASITFQLTVTDDGGLQATDLCNINISPGTSPPSGTSSVTLQWDPNADASYYIVYWGEETGSYPYGSNNIYTPATSYTVSGLADQPYYFAVKAFNECGNSSDFSTEVAYSPAPTNTAPIANAGPDQTVAEGSLVTISANNSSDSDDGIASYLWTQTGGPTVSLSSTSAVQPSFTAPDVGTTGASLTFQVTVTDTGGLKDTDTCIVNVSFVNKPPVAEAGPSQTISEGTTVSLNASGSSDPDDGIASYLWTQTGGPGVTLSSKSASKPTFTAPDVGSGGDSLTFQLTVTDKGGLQATDTCIVNVTFINQSPVAEAGTSQSVKEGVTVTLNASGSTDPDDGIATYHWQQTAGATVALSSSTAMAPTFIAPDVDSAGDTLTFKLTVSDHGGLQSADTCNVTVSYVNNPPVAEAGPEQTIAEGTSVTLNGSGSTDPDDGIASYQWIQTAGPSITLSRSTAMSPTFTAPAVGPDGAVLLFQLTVTDTGGLQSTDTCGVNVSFVNVAPTAEAGPSLTVKEGDQVTLDASASTDPDDGIASYQWVQTAGTFVALTGSNTMTLTFTAPDVGEAGEALSFKLTVTDKGGLTSSDTCVINVSFTNEAPVADAGTTQTVDEGARVTLNASGSSDPDDGIVSYLWSQTTGTTVSLSSTTAVSPTFTAPDVTSSGEALTFQLTVTDKGGLKATDTCAVNIIFVNKAPTAEAGPAQTAAEGSTVTLNGTGSTDPDDGIASYLWVQTAGPTVTLSSATDVSPSFLSPDVGTEGASLTFTLTVTDLGGLQSSDTCTVNISFVNKAPVAEAGPTQTVAEGVTVTLNASGSTDPDDGIASYSWTQTGGPSVPLSSPTAVTPTFTAPDVTSGTALTFELTVTDNGGLTSTDTSIVNVTFINEAPLAEAGPSQTVEEGTVVTLSASGSSDPDDGIASYYWKQIAGPSITLSGTAELSPTFTAPDVDTRGAALTFELTVTDNGGLQATDTCIINVSFANSPPVAEAGPTQTVEEGAAVSLNASGSSDPDDGIASYLWTQTGGPAVTLSNPAAVDTTFTAPEVEASGTSLTFQLTVTDNGGLQATDTCIVNVSYTNKPPIAEAGPSQTVKEGVLVTLSGTGSTDPDDGIASYVWKQIDGPVVTISNTTSMTPTFTSPDVDASGASLTFQLTVTDTGGLQSSDTCIVNVSFINVAPVAEAGSTQTVSEEELVTLNGSGSSDPDDGIASYHWIQVTGTSVRLSSTTDVMPTFTSPAVAPEGESMTFQLTVTDTGGLQSTDTCIVNITDVNLAPVAEAGPSQSVAEGVTVTLDGSGSTDPDDGIASYLWAQTSGPAVVLHTASGVTSTFLSPGVSADGTSLTFQLTVTDKSGLQSSDTCIVNISFSNEAPLADAGPSATATVGSTVTLDAGNSTDPDDGIASFAWAQTGGPSVTLTDSSSAQSTFTAPEIRSDGTPLTFQVTVTDMGGLQSTASCTITVFNVNLEPVAEAGSDQTVTEGANVTLDGSGSTDPDDGIASYYWTQTDGLPVTLSGSTDTQPTFTAPDVSTSGATLTFQLTVTDKGGQESTDTCTITVKASAIVETPPTPTSPVDLIATLSDYPSIEVLNRNRQHLHWLKIGWLEYNEANGEARVATGDIDGDGEDEIIIGMARVPDNPAIPGGFFQVLDHDYTHLTWGYVNWPEYNAANGETWPACGDLDGDGDDEVIIGLGTGGEGTLEVFDFDQGDLFHLEWVIGAWPEYNTAVGESRPACGDINNDGSDEIIVGLAPVTENAAIPSGFFEIIDSGFNHITWGEVSWADYNTENGETWPATGDITGDGQDEIVIGLGKGGNGRAQVFEYNQNAVDSSLVHASWIQLDWREYNADSGETRPSLADIDRDGKKEILTGLGPVEGNRKIPGGMFQANDDDFSFLSWGQVTWREYNTVNGETRLTESVVANNETILISLGAKPVKKSSPGRDKKR